MQNIHWQNDTTKTEDRRVEMKNETKEKPSIRLTLFHFCSTIMDKICANLKHEWNKNKMNSEIKTWKCGSERWAKNWTIAAKLYELFQSIIYNVNMNNQRQHQKKNDHKRKYMCTDWYMVGNYASTLEYVRVKWVSVLP